MASILASYPVFMHKTSEPGDGMPLDSELHSESHPAHSRVSIGQALQPLLRNPWQRIVLRWNAKAALLSAMTRGIIFLAASAKSHHHGRSSGALAEAVWGALNAGVFGTFTQSLRFAEPRWAAELLIAFAFPVMFQVGDVCFHAALGTQKFLIGMISSAVFTALSAAFNLYIMRRGTLLTGDEGKPFVEDLAAMPGLIFRFVASGAMNAWRFGVGLSGLGAPRDTVA